MKRCPAKVLERGGIQQAEDVVDEFGWKHVENPENIWRLYKDMAPKS
jgi:hypothetical protein